MNKTLLIIIVVVFSVISGYLMARFIDSRSKKDRKLADKGLDPVRPSSDALKGGKKSKNEIDNKDSTTSNNQSEIIKDYKYVESEGIKVVENSIENRLK